MMGLAGSGPHVWRVLLVTLNGGSQAGCPMDWCEKAKSLRAIAAGLEESRSAARDGK
jgi:hypothetical protein